jgi:hypothetical protein
VRVRGGDGVGGRGMQGKQGRFQRKNLIIACFIPPQYQVSGCWDVESVIEMCQHFNRVRWVGGFATVTGEGVWGEPHCNCMRQQQPATCHVHDDLSMCSSRRSSCSTALGKANNSHHNLLKHTHCCMARNSHWQ